MGNTFLKILARKWGFFPFPLDVRKSFCTLAMIMFCTTKNELCRICLWCYQIIPTESFFRFSTLSKTTPPWCTSINSSLISLAPAFVHVPNNDKKKERLRKIQNKNCLWKGACLALSRHSKIFAYKTLIKFALSSMPRTWDAIPSNCSTSIAYHMLWPDRMQ